MQLILNNFTIHNYNFHIVYPTFPNVEACKAYLSNDTYA